MSVLYQILLSLKIIRLTVKRVDKWTKNREVDKLEYALQYGLYNVRQKAAFGLGEINSKGSLRLLTKSIDDKIKKVSFAAMSAIDKIGTTPKLEQKIKEKKEYWVRKEEIESSKNKKKRGKYSIHKWERTSKKSLENVKQMLKKPMIGGKWF